METINKEGRGLCCRSCRFSSESFPGSTGLSGMCEKFQCRRRAPIIGRRCDVDEFGVAVGYHVPEWPVVEAYYWCGEYEPGCKDETK